MAEALRNFYQRRIARIFPIYYLLVLLLATIYPTVRAALPWLLTFTGNLYIIKEGTYNGITDHLWSLAVEEQFYLLWPFLILFAPLRKFIPIFLSITLIAVCCRLGLWLAGFNRAEIAIFTGSCFDSLALGALLAYFHRVKPEEFRRFSLQSQWAWYFFGISLALTSVNAYILPIEPIEDILLRTFFSVFCFFFIAGAIAEYRSAAKILLENAVIAFVGRISYAIYLFHFLMGELFASLHWNEFLPAPLLPLFYFLAVIILATLSWFLIEKPLRQHLSQSRTSYSS